MKNNKAEAAEAAEEDKPVADAALQEIPEIEIMAKVMAGLTRDQATEVIKNQRAHDAKL